MTTHRTTAAATRRAVLSSSIAVAGLLTASTIAETEAAAVDPHTAWLERWRVVATESNEILSAVAAGDPEPEAALHLEAEADELFRLIAVTPARTMAGATAKLRLYWEETSELKAHGGTYDALLISSALATLEALEG